MEKNAKQIRAMTLGFIAFVCSILLTGGALLLVIEHTLSADFLTKAAVKSDYYTKLTEQITTQLQDIGLGSGIPWSVLEDVIEVDQVQDHFETYSYNAFTGNSLTIEKEPFLEKINQPIYTYSESKNQSLTPETTQGIALFSEKSYDVYSSYINLPYLPAVGQRIQVFSSKLFLFQIILAVSLILLMILLSYLLHGWLHRLLRYLAHILSGSGLMLIALPSLTLISGIIKRVSIVSPPLYVLITTYLTNILLVLIYLGIGFIVTALILGIISTLLRKHKIAV